MFDILCWLLSCLLGIRKTYKQLKTSNEEADISELILELLFFKEIWGTLFWTEAL